MLHFVWHKPLLLMEERCTINSNKKMPLSIVLSSAWGFSHGMSPSGMQRSRHYFPNEIRLAVCMNWTLVEPSYAVISINDINDSNNGYGCFDMLYLQYCWLELTCGSFAQLHSTAAPAVPQGEMWSTHNDHGKLGGLNKSRIITLFLDDVIAKTSV